MAVGGVTQPEPDDCLDWDITRDGRMRDYATTPEDEPATTCYEGDD